MADKRSFLRLPFDVDAARLLAELGNVPADEWLATHWPYPHGSVETLLLRGGETDTEHDYTTTHVVDRPILEALPTFAELIGPSGPLGRAFYAFVFRMSAGGEAKLHRDAHPVWYELYRVHIPLETNPGSRLVAEEQRAQHFGLGEAWTFDNQAVHGAINGDAQRTHLIMDVPASNPEMAAALEQAVYAEGEPVSDELWARLLNAA